MVFHQEAQLSAPNSAIFFLLLCKFKMISDQTSSLSKVSVRFIKTLHSLLATKRARSVWQRGHYTDSLLHLVVQSGITGVQLSLALADISATKYKDVDFHPSVYPDHGCGVCSLRRPSSSSHLIQQTVLNTSLKEEAELPKLTPPTLS